MFRGFLRLITYLIEDFKFLGLRGGFWFITIPLLIFIINIETKEKDKLNAAEDFADEIPVHSLEFKVNAMEKWQIGQTLKRLQYKSIDDMVQDIIENI